MKTLALIVNPTAGKMRIKGELIKLLQIFCQEGFSVSVHVTSGRLDATRFVEKRGKDFDVLVACGGDGTFNEVMAGAMKIRYEGALGFLPCGTTNDLARSFGLPKSLEEGARSIAAATPRYVDFASFNKTRYFSYIAAFGAFTEVSYATDQNLKNILGHAAYVAEAALTLKKIRSYRVRITCDGREYEDDFLFGAAINSHSIGGVLKLKKSDVQIDDGMHEVFLVRSMKKPTDLDNFFRELITGNFENKSILLFRGQEIRFDCEEPLAWCVDGEFAGKHDSAVVHNLAKRLKILLPEKQ